MPLGVAGCAVSSELEEFAVVEVNVAVVVEVNVVVVVEVNVAVVAVGPGFDVKHVGRMRVSVSDTTPHVPPHSALQLAERERVCVPGPQPAGAHSPQPP